MERIQIRDVLIPALKARFPTRPFGPGALPNSVAAFAAEHPAIGDVEITDDGTEVTVYVGEITHGHFNSYEPSLSETQLAQAVSDEVLGFLADLFADRVLLWAAPGGGQGGWQHPFDGSAPSGIRPDADLFVWSGPLSNNSRSNRELAR